MEESLIKPNHFGSGTENILYVENFVDKQDLRTIMKFCKSIREWNNPRDSEFNEDGTCIYDASYWWDRMCSGDIIQRLDMDIYNLIEFYIIKMQKMLEFKFSVSLSIRPSVLIRWLPGNAQSPHADKQLNDGTPNPFPTYDINSIIYWNEEFEGGEFYYPQYDMELKIKAGMAVAHPGDINYLHGVKEVKTGVRWTTPSFYTITKLGEK